MLSISEYIRIILTKKNISNAELCRRMNEVEESLGEKRTRPQNITNYLNGVHEIRPKWLVKVEKALDLPLGTLVNMVPAPVTKESKQELKQIIDKIYKKEGKKC